jgi:hypothetical protein
MKYKKSFKSYFSTALLAAGTLCSGMACADESSPVSYPYSLHDKLSGWDAAFTDPALPQGLPDDARLATYHFNKGNVSQFNDARLGIADFQGNKDTVAQSLLGLLQNSRFSAFTFGHDNDRPLSANSLALSPNISSMNELASHARGAALSYTVHAFHSWSFSLSSAYLKEDDVLLGTSDNQAFFLKKTNTLSTGFGASVNLGRGYNFGFDVLAASTKGSSGGEGAITGMSRLSSFGMSAVLTKDNFSFSVQKPLRVFSGSANADVVTGKDNAGNAIIENKKIEMSPTGNETDFGFTYKLPPEFGEGSSLGLAYRRDADNISGLHDSVVMYRYRTSF